MEKSSTLFSEMEDLSVIYWNDRVDNKPQIVGHLCSLGEYKRVKYQD